MRGSPTVHNLGLAAANLVLEATARGLAVHQMIGILPERAREVYAVPAGVQPLISLAIGYAGDTASLPEALRPRDAARRRRPPGARLELDAAFADIARLAEACSFADCSHTHEPRCAVRQALAEGSLDTARYESYQKLQRELAYEESRSDARVALERKERERRIHRVYGKQQRRKGS
jgi:hypothetical protein